MHLLRYGRHLRLDNKTKIVVGRTQKDNDNIKNFYDSTVDTLIKVKNIPGPIVLMPRGGSKEMTILSASICTGYSKAPDSVPVDVQITTHQGREIIKVVGIPPKNIRHFLI